jgi:beta-glucosidase
MTSITRRGWLGLVAAGAGACAARMRPKTPTDGARTFPKGFLWGAATSAFQIEGAVKEDGRGESIWDRFAHTEGMIANGDVPDVACDHYHRWAEDLDLAKSLGLSAYRFSIAWPRVQPTGSGAVNQKGLDFYSRLVDGVLARGLAPMATLYHWDLPQPLEDAGGWPARDTAQRFADYATIVAKALGDRLPMMATLNEPALVAAAGYGVGKLAPGRKDWTAMGAALDHLLLAHGLGVQALRAGGARGKIGIVLNLEPVLPATDSPEDREAARLRQAIVDGAGPEPIFHGRFGDGIRASLKKRGVTTDVLSDDDAKIAATPIDFLGVNYYSPNPVRMGEHGPENVMGRFPHAQLDWEEIDPEALTILLEDLHARFGAPELYVTENGVAYPDPPPPIGVTLEDSARITYLHDHLAAAHRAIERGVKLRGYFVWSLLDNFEWSDGFAPRFGLVSVDYATQRRAPKRSAAWYAQVARTSTLTAS